MATQLCRAHFALTLVFSWIALPALSLAQSLDPCTDINAQRSWHNLQNPVYANAMELEHTLKGRGIIVDCVRASKMEDFFEGQKGAAWYKTDQGVFEVLFLPKSKTFAALEIVAQAQDDGRFIYSFRGQPFLAKAHDAAKPIDSSKPISFVKYENLLLMVWNNELLAERLSAVLQKP